MIELRGFSIECGPPISDRDWWSLAVGIAAGMVEANRQWMRGRDLAALDLSRCGIRYVAAQPRRSSTGEWQQVGKLAPAVLHTREGSCLDLSAWMVALELERHPLRSRRRGSPSHGPTRVDILFDPNTQRGHAVAILRGRLWDPSTYAGA